MSMVISSSSFAQDFPGYRSSNYSGVNSVFFNPANIADSRYRWDINVFSIGTLLVNNNASFSFKELRDFEDDKIKTQLFGDKAGPASGLLTGNVFGPSFMIATAMPGTSNVFRVRSTNESICGEVMTCAERPSEKRLMEVASKKDLNRTVDCMSFILLKYIEIL